ncbi:hypothetical protein [Streptosporangium sp. NPDC000396]|uniref:hypothetical protein n=1 Tax=Streptosporangium sp. NPDC000396 TaxID=3366185 RepID=UPI003680879B
MRELASSRDGVPDKGGSRSIGKVDRKREAGDGRKGNRGVVNGWKGAIGGLRKRKEVGEKKEKKRRDGEGVEDGSGGWNRKTEKEGV